MSDVIKNPNRSTPTIQKPYEPERVRLGREPILMADAGQQPYMAVDKQFVGSDVDDVQIESGHIIDNNDYVFPPQTQSIKNSEKEPENILETNVVTSPEVGDYILMVFGKLVLSGSKEKIESKVKDIMYGDDVDFTSLEVSSDDIIVLKRMPIKIGIFIDE